MSRLTQLRPTPGSLDSRLLEERPGRLPAMLRDPGTRHTQIASVLIIGPDGIDHRSDVTPDLLGELTLARIPFWLRFSGLSDLSMITRCLDACDVRHEFFPLLTETPQITRIDSFADEIAVVLHRLKLEGDPLNLVSDQVSLLLNHNCLVSIEEAPGPEQFASLTDWFTGGNGRVSREDLDDLLCYLVEDSLDDIYPILDIMASRLDELEERALRNPQAHVLSCAYQLRANLRRIRQQVWPLRHQVILFLRQNQPVMGVDGLRGFQEMTHNIERLFEGCEILRHQCDGVVEAHMASMGNRMNQIMKALAIVSTIFAPLTFIAGIYGMNFRYMPELGYRHGYVLSLGVMGIVAVLQVAWLWRLGWFKDWSHS